MRLATLGDALDILRWRNDPLTRAMSRNHVALEETPHRAWLSRVLDDSGRLLLIGTEDGKPFGMVRFDKHDADQWEVSIAMAPETRSRGMGKLLLKLALSRFFFLQGAVSVVAEVRQDNPRSQRLFIATGFIPDGQGGNSIRYILQGPLPSAE